MNRKQVLLFLLFVVIIAYAIINGFWGHSKPLHHYILFILVIVPSVSILTGLIFRIVFERESLLKKMLLSSISCLTATILIVFVYTVIYKQLGMLFDLLNFILYCLIVNVMLIFFNILLIIAGKESFKD
jgi:hypothetical protein